jgi:blue light- and temperature-responsive anti-repressor
VIPMRPDLYRLAYVSHACGFPAAWSGRGLPALVATSRALNRRAGLTGAIAFAGGTCGQILEGPLEAVEATFERIERDRRHRDVTLLDLTPIEVRSFGPWPLALVAPGAQARLDALAETTGFTSAVRAGERLHVLLRDRLARRGHRPA